MMSEKSKELA